VRADRREGCQLLYVSPYSPDLNPIEGAYPRIKRFLRELRAHTRGTLKEAIGKTLDAVSTRDLEGFLERCTHLRRRDNYDRHHNIIRNSCI
jgi:hypothetical protein